MKKAMIILSVLLGISTIGLGFYSAILPKLYLGILIGVYIFIIGIMVVLYRWKNRVVTVIGIILFIILMITSIGMDFVFIRIGQILNHITQVESEVSDYVVIVLKDSRYKNIDDIFNKEISVFKDSSKEYSKALDELNSIIQGNFIYYDNALELANDLLEGNREIIFISKNYISILNEGINNFENKIKILDTFKVKHESQAIKSYNKIEEKNSFNIYISGIDTYGGISTVSRSDVNILATVNLNTSKILLTSVPRDMYVSLAGRDGLKDKLTHAGVYGIDTSIGTLENFLNTDIDYYVRINFNSLISLVDYLGGVDIESDYEFNAGSYRFVKGINYGINGKQALAFSRQRYAFVDGDRQRGRNQEKVIEAIIEKVTKSRNVNTYLNLVTTMEKSFQTNMSRDMINQLIHLQLENNYRWNIESSDVNGYDHTDYTYSYPWQKLYVMLVNEDSLNSAKERINNTYIGK